VVRQLLTIGAFARSAWLTLTPRAPDNIACVVADVVRLETPATDDVGRSGGTGR
jgi:hypothetical protein